MRVFLYNTFYNILIIYYLYKNKKEAEYKLLY